MQIKFKLFATVLACGLFLVGCGGGGSSSGSGVGDGGEQALAISFDDFDNTSIFPAFSLGGVSANVFLVEKSKAYNITQAVFDDFNATVLSDYSYDVSTNWYTRPDAESNITYNVYYNGTESTLQLSFYSFSNVTSLTDSTYEGEFGVIDGSLTNAFVYVSYDSDISSEYANYAMNNAKFLKKQGFSTTTVDGKYVSQKYSVDDLFVYQWREISNYSYQHIIFVK
ncbi:MAG: hypothetical protein LBI78_04355 [Campylobacteraceae bacterium]|jgi:hypothetical protein|nr:hypothetical protein [Campylobacteraceae bacterium]